MRTVCAADAKNRLGELADMARAAPVAITKYPGGRPSNFRRALNCTP